MICRVVAGKSEPEIRVVVQEVAENRVTVPGVVHGIENVLVPKTVDFKRGRCQVVRKLLHQVQETPILPLRRVCPFRGPAFVHQPEFDRLQIQGINN